MQEQEGPFEVGSRLRQTNRMPGGRELTTVLEVSGLEPGRGLDLRMVEGPLSAEAKIRLRPTGSATVLRFAARGRPRGPMRLLQPVLSRTMQHQLEQHCANLKAVLEGEPRPPG